MVAVSLNGIRVDANLCDLQNIGLPEDSFLSSFSLSLALFSCPLLPHYFQQLYKVNWRIVERETFPTEPVTSEAHPYPYRLRPVRGRQTQIKYVINLTGLVEVLRLSWYQSKKFKMVDRRDWGGGEDDPEESTQRMIERIWESLTDIKRMMDQQAPVPPVAVPPGEWRDCTYCSSPARSGGAFCSTCATTTTSVISRGTSDASGEVSKIAAAYLLRRAESRYSGALGL
ncbi:hypothetical protein Taro_000685 [Colocasia esculenta]|uniref:Uncharacterized protein n=1 Tax=Colocasia esculenta TaxID=4460 RepID=A0A843TDV2_COLES|nr:hypothetical protein [Colocasia esculenta]